MANVKGPTLFGKRMLEWGVPDVWYADVPVFGFVKVDNGDGDYQATVLAQSSYPCSYTMKVGPWRKSPQSAANDAERYLRRLRVALERMGA